MENLVHRLVTDVHLYDVLLLHRLFLNNQLDDQLIKLLLVLHHMHVELIQQHVYVRQIVNHNQFSIFKKFQLKKYQEYFFVLMIEHALDDLQLLIVHFYPQFLPELYL